MHYWTMAGHQLKSLRLRMQDGRHLHGLLLLLLTLLRVLSTASTWGHNWILGHRAGVWGNLLRNPLSCRLGSLGCHRGQDLVLLYTWMQLGRHRWSHIEASVAWFAGQRLLLLLEEVTWAKLAFAAISSLCTKGLLGVLPPTPSSDFFVICFADAACQEASQCHSKTWTQIATKIVMPILDTFSRMKFITNR